MTNSTAVARAPRSTTVHARTWAKNAATFGALVAGWYALETGYLSPDRPTRSQWQRLEAAGKSKGGDLVYQSDFSREGPAGGKGRNAHWGYYNGASAATVKADQAGVTVSYNGIAWIGAALHFTGFEPDRIYRLTLERTVEGEPAAVIVRNRQMDLTRKRIPVGTGTFAFEFVSPPGSRDKVDIAFIPDNTGKPQGTFRITSFKIERLGE